MNNNIEKEFNQIREGIEVARGTPYNSNADSLASGFTRQRVVRSEDDGTSPVEGSSAEVYDSASSSMESNDTYGSVAALFSYEARKQGMATTLKGDMHQESMSRFGHYVPRDVGLC